MAKKSNVESEKLTVSAREVTWGSVAAILVSIGIFIIPQILVGLILAVYLSVNGQSLDFVMSDLSPIQNFLLILSVEAVTTLLLFWFLKKRKATFASLGLGRMPNFSDVIKAIVGWAVYFPSLILVITVVGLIFKSFNVDQAQVTGFENAAGLELVPAFVGLVLLPALIEEVLFRGFLYQGLKKSLTPLRAALLTSLAFGAAHLQWNVAIDTFILSIVLIYLLERTGSLWASIFLHFIKNLIAFVFLFK